MKKQSFIRSLAGIAVLGLLTILALVIVAATSSQSEGPITSGSLSESGARVGDDPTYATIEVSLFAPKRSTDEVTKIARQFVVDNMGLTSAAELPVRTAIGKVSGQRHDNGELVKETPVNIVVFHDYPAWPRIPKNYAGPRMIEPRFTVAIDDASGVVIFSLLTWGHEKQ